MAQLLELGESLERRRLVPLLPPGVQYDERNPTEALADTAGAFLLPMTPHVEAGSATELQTPIDEATGMPYVILPYDMAHSVGSNYHHHFFPKRFIVRPALSRGDNRANPEDLSLVDLARLSVRMCRGQILPREIHHAIHHKDKLSGPVLPATIDESLLTVTKAIAGVIPRHALDVRKTGKAMKTVMNNDTLHQLMASGTICAERVYRHRAGDYTRRVIGSFIMRYAVEQDLHHLSPCVIEEFLETADDLRRLELGNLIMREALNMSIAPIIPIHTNLKRLGLVAPDSPDVRTVVKKTLRREQYPRFFPALSASLQAA